MQEKCMIALSRKSVNWPRIGRWLREMSSHLTMEQITYIVKDIWGPFLDFVKQSDVGEILVNEGNSG